MNIAAHERPRAAFVLAGGGRYGAVQVGMLRDVFPIALSRLFTALVRADHLFEPTVCGDS
jgi:hypothetical protein